MIRGLFLASLLLVLTAPARAAPLHVASLGVIPHAALDRVLAGTPGQFLTHVDLEPRFASGRFLGWRLASFFPGDPRFDHVDLRAGDVILRVNGRSVERPEQLMQVWSELRSAHELVVDILRDGRPKSLRWTIAR